MQLIFIHLHQNLARTLILLRQLADVMLQMHADLALCFRHKAKAVFVAGNPGNCAHAKRKAVPDRVQQAGMAVQLFQAVFAPGQVILFFNGCLFHLAAHIRQLGGQRLAVVQRLRADFAAVIDPHQPRNMARFAHRKLGIGLNAWIFSMGCSRTGN